MESHSCSGSVWVHASVYPFIASLALLENLHSILRPTHYHLLCRDLTLSWPPCAEGPSEERQKWVCWCSREGAMKEGEQVESQRLKKVARRTGWRSGQPGHQVHSLQNPREREPSWGGVQGLCTPGCRLRQETGLQPVLNLHTISIMAGVLVHLPAKSLFLP